MKIGFVFTNYNNSLLSIQAVESIFLNHGDLDFEIVIVDNASTANEIEIISTHFSKPIEKCTIIYNSENIGYFPGLNLGINHLTSKSKNIDAIVVGNNDLVFGSDFFLGLTKRAELLSQFSVLCPNLVTLDGVHQNPHVLNGVSRLREIIWDLYYANFALSILITFISNSLRSIVERKDYTEHHIEREIYSGYGACYILSSKFLNKHKELWAPTFLMGEEFFLTQQLSENDEKMYYVPEILVNHHDHATLSKIATRKLWNISRNAHKVYRYFISPYYLNMDKSKSIGDYNSAQ